MDKELAALIEGIEDSPEYKYLTTHMGLMKRIRVEAHRQGLSLLDLANKAGIQKQALSRLLKEDSNPTLRTLVGISHALGVELSSLISSDLASSKSTDQAAALSTTNTPSSDSASFDPHSSGNYIGGAKSTLRVVSR